MIVTSNSVTHNITIKELSKIGQVDSNLDVINSAVVSVASTIGFSQTFNNQTITGLRKNPHIAHAHFDMTFKWIEELKPKFTYLTHFSPASDNEEVLKLCPMNVEPAYDGLIINI